MLPRACTYGFFQTNHFSAFFYRNEHDISNTERTNDQ